jgi:hypothetical protein
MNPTINPNTIYSYSTREDIKVDYYYYYLLTAIGLMPGGSVYKGYTGNKEHSTPVSRKDDTYISRYNTNTVA